MVTACPSWYNRLMNQFRVLLADDHALVRSGIRNALTELPELLVVGEVGDGPGVESALENTPVDLLLIDVTMPNFDPIQAIERIRATYPLLKILVVSAYDDDIYVQGLLGAGVDGYHLKDQPLSDLRLAVTRVLAGERWVSSRLVSKLIVANPNHHPQPTASSLNHMAGQYHSGQHHPSLLTTRQQGLLQLLYEGLDNQSIARRMSISIKTVENHLTRIYRQLAVQSRLEAVNYAMQHPEVLGVPDQSDPLPSYAGEDELSILLVDDNQRYRRRLRQMVATIQNQADLHEAHDIEHALEVTRQVSPDLAFVDVVLGDEDGIACTRRIRTLCPTTRVILISAYPDREFHRRGLEAGAIAFLDKKDLDADALRHVIDDVISLQHD